MNPVQNTPVNFFMGGGRYISDNFNMQILDTSNPNCFENLELTSITPDMMDNYINSEKLPNENQLNDGKSFWDTIKNFFSSPPSTPEESQQESNFK